MDVEAYFMVNVVCILFIAIILIGEAATTYRNKAHTNFFIMIILMAVLFAVEIVGHAMGSGDISAGDTLHWAVYLTYYVLLVAIIAMWVRHCITLIGVSNYFSKIFSILYLALAVFILITPLTGLYVSMDEGKIVREGMYQPIMFLVMLPAVFSSALGAWETVHTRDISTRTQNITLCVILIPMLILYFVELYVDMPLFNTGLVISSVSVYIVMKEQMITIDKLTGLNNKASIRREVSRLMDKFDAKDKKGSIMNMIYEGPLIQNPLVSSMAVFTEKKYLYLAMMDMNHFKTINDSYGHTEGDIALRDFAYILRRACEGTGFIPGRYAGDEFVIYGECNDVSELEAVIEKIHRGCAEMNKPYEFGTSIGYVQYKQEYRTFTSFLKEADDMMFRVKRESRT